MNEDGQDGEGEGEDQELTWALHASTQLATATRNCDSTLPNVWHGSGSKCVKWGARQNPHPLSKGFVRWLLDGNVRRLRANRRVSACC